MCLEISFYFPQGTSRALLKLYHRHYMKRKASSQAVSSRRKRPARSTSTTTVQAVVKKELRKKTDWKYTDVFGASVAVYNTGATMISMYTNLIRGDLGINNFDGNIIRPQAMLFKYYAETSQVFNVLRVMIVQWFDAAVPVMNGFIQQTATGTACISPTLVTNKQYIKVLYDKTHMLSPSAGNTTTLGGYGVMEPVTVYIPGKRLRNTRFNSGTNFVQDGNIYLFAVSDDSALGTVNLTYYSRITFADD